ncbi:MAG: hypothetical protein JW395_4105 [Nitrospira sp.]|nr:hypothetical protein [Nitrospira sp.]
MLIIEIAIGIVVAVFILNYLTEILAGAVILVLGLTAIAIFLAVGSESGGLLLLTGFLVWVLVEAKRSADARRAARGQERRDELGAEDSQSQLEQYQREAVESRRRKAAKRRRPLPKARRAVWAAWSKRSTARKRKAGVK